ncbi:hypothetical protein D3C71_1931510 [compost metagenome]
MLVRPLNDVTAKGITADAAIGADIDQGAIPEAGIDARPGEISGVPYNRPDRIGRKIGPRWHVLVRSALGDRAEKAKIDFVHCPVFRNVGRSRAPYFAGF